MEEAWEFAALMNMPSHITAHPDESRGPELVNAMLKALDTDFHRYEREVGVFLSCGAAF